MKRARKGDPGRWVYDNPARASRIGETARREGTTPRQIRRRRKADRRRAKAAREALLAHPLGRILAAAEREAKR